MFQSSVSCAKAVKDPGMVLKERLWQKEFHQKNKGKIYDKKPFKMTVRQGKKYIRCACGQSKSQVRNLTSFRHFDCCDGDLVYSGTS